MCGRVQKGDVKPARRDHLLCVHQNFTVPGLYLLTSIINIEKGQNATPENLKHELQLNNLPLHTHTHTCAS